MYDEYTYKEDLNKINKNIICIGHFVNKSTKIEHQCLVDGNVWSIAPKTVLRGIGCPACKANKSKLTYDKIYNSILKDGCTLLTTEECFNGEKNTVPPSKIKLRIQCKCGGEFNKSYNEFNNSKKQCPECSKLDSIELKNNLLNIKMQEKVKSEFDKRGCILIDEYVNAKTLMRYVGSCGHEDKVSYDSYKNRIDKTGLCSHCARRLYRGENAYNWNGGSSESQAYRKTYESKNFVRQVMKRDKFTCKICGHYSTDLNVHHLDGYNWCKEKRTDVENGITLCKTCHDSFHDMYGRGDNTKEQLEEYLQVLKIYGNDEITCKLYL